MRNHKGNFRSIGCRHGLTIVEFVALASIVLLVGAVTLPAVQQSREAARTDVCSDNLRLIGVASLEYESVNGQYPPYLGVCFPTPTPPVSEVFEYQLTYSLTQLLPFLDQQSLVDQVDPIAFNTDCVTIAEAGYNDFFGEWLNPVDKESPGVEAIVFNNAIDTFLCPADVSAIRDTAMLGIHPSNTAGTQTWVFQLSKNANLNITNYVSNGGGIAITDTPSQGLINSGWLGFHGPIRSRISDSFDSIGDGAANVILFGETLGSIQPDTPAETFRNIRQSAALGGFCVGRPDVYVGIEGLFGTSKSSNFLQFGSPHPDVVNTLRADGAVDTVHRNIQRITFGRLCGVEDGLPLLSFSK